MKVNEYNEIYDLLLYEEDEVKNKYESYDSNFRQGVLAGIMTARKIVSKFFVESNSTRFSENEVY